MTSSEPVAGERFVIRRQLGEGGMGVVYEAFDTELSMTVALKTLRATSANLLYHFKNEFRSLADLHHPNLITLYELFARDGKWFFTMEIVDGVGFVRYVRSRAMSDHERVASTVVRGEVPSSPDTLMPAPGADRTMLSWGSRTETPAPAAAPASWNGRYDEGRLRRSLGQLAAGLSALHGAGKVHRDIKPSNIMVAGDGRVVLMDFGLAADAALMEEWAVSKVVAGTPAYMAPEQGQPGAIGTAADWYAVGAILYEILGGRLPHGGDTLEDLVQAKKSAPAPLSTLDLDVEPPEDLASLCERLLDPDPAARPDGAAVLSHLGLSLPARAGDTKEVFVGRERELETLRGAFRDSRDSAVSVFVQGPSGLGKTALVERFLGEIRAQGAMILKGRCYAEESLPYKGFDGIIDALSRNLITVGPLRMHELVPDTAPLAARIFPVLLRVPLIDEPPPAEGINAVELRTRAFEALGDLLSRIAESQSLVLFVDDLQWADADSLLLLRELLHPDVAPSVLLISSVRASAKDAAELAQAARLQPRVIPIEPLGEADTRELLERLAPGQSQKRRDEIEREASGHPLFIAELARSELASGARLDDALWERARALPDDSRRVLEVVAVAGTPVDLGTVVEATGLGPAQCAKLASTLRGEHLVKNTPTPNGSVMLEPYHDRVRESVVTRLDPADLSRVSGSLAGALLSAGVGETAPELVVRHLLAAGDSAQAVELAERAAQRALAALAFDRAAEFLETALEAGPRDAEHARRLHLRLAEALSSAGRGARAADAFLSASADVDDVTRLDCRRLAAEQLLASGHVDRGLVELEQVMAILGESLPDTPEASLASLEATRAELDRGSLQVPTRSADAIDPDLLRRLDTCQATSIGLILVDNVRGADFQARALRLALAAGEPRRLIRALILEGIYRAQENETGRRRARELVTVARQVAHGRDDPWMDGYLVLAEAWLSYYEGRFKHSAELFSRADDQFRQLSGVAWEQNTILIHRLRATDYQGAWGELRGLYDEYLRDAQRRDDRYIEASIRRWFNVLWLAHDHPDLAGQDLDNSPWTPPAEGRYHLQHFLELRARVELALYRGDGASQGSWARPGLDAAERSQVLRIQIARAIGDWVRGRIAACEGDAEGVEAMVRQLDAQHINYAAIWSGLLSGAALALRGDRAGAAQSLEHTAQLAMANDFALCAEFARLRAAQLCGDAAGVERSLSWMRAQDIHNPHAMAEVFAPGFGT